MLSADPRLRIIATRRGSWIVRFEAASAGQRRLRGLITSGELQSALGCRIIDHFFADDEMTEVPMVSLAARARVSHSICFSDYIEGWESEGDRGTKIVGAATRNLQAIRVYVTKRDGIVYAHSNYMQPGHDVATKVGFGAERELFFLFLALTHPLGKPARLPSAPRMRELFDAHRYHVTYLFEPTVTRVDRQGAHTVIRLPRSEERS